MAVTGRRTAPAAPPYVCGMNTSEQLFQAIRSADATGAVQLLEQHPTLIHARDARGATPLVLASYLDELTIAEQLIAAGAGLNVKDGTGSTPLMGVSFKGHVAVATYLLERGAAVNIRGPRGFTALMFAVLGKHVEVAELLLRSGADTTLVDEQGLTAADHARQSGLTDMASLLE